MTKRTPYSAYLIMETPARNRHLHDTSPFQIFWLAGKDSNLQPCDYHSQALPLSYPPVFLFRNRFTNRFTNRFKSDSVAVFLAARNARLISLHRMRCASFSLGDRRSYSRSKIFSSRSSKSATSRRYVIGHRHSQPHKQRRTSPVALRNVRPHDGHLRSHMMTEP